MNKEILLRALAYDTGVRLDFLSEQLKNRQELNVSIPDGKNDIYLDGIILPSDANYLSDYEDELGVITPKGFRNKMQVAEGDLTLWINCIGGHVSGASSMWTALDKYRSDGNKVHSIVAGNCASAATYFLLGSDTAEISKMGRIMVHRSMACVCGNVNELNKIAQVTSDIDDVYIAELAEYTGQDRKKIEKMVDEETWFTAQQAVDVGLVNGIYNPKGSKSKDTTRNRLRHLAAGLYDC